MTTIIPGGGWMAIVPMEAPDRNMATFLETPIVAWIIEDDGSGRPVIVERDGTTAVFQGVVSHPEQRQREIPPSSGGDESSWGRRAAT